eukprot:TRINITY_DN74734_c0_g1_i1.p1 TRINITY_DN74734_c0_g1~~TRINITY_DN74734_c0_g1_i1.p1  ORF type:complete len:453 (-),score=136.30 TRINITY_DN74734_c0_g1_i1:131-1489(-)
MKVVRDSKFRHVWGDALKTKYEDLRLSTKATESCGIRGNGSFFAFAWESGGGGTLAVIPNTRTGRLPRDIPLVAGHSGPILDFEFSPFDDNILVSSSEDMTVKVWQIPDGGLKAHLKEPVVNLEGHQKKVSFCHCNPTVAGIVASAAFDLTLRIWNYEEQEEVFQMPTPEQVTHMKWNYSGGLLATTMKDKTLRIVDPRAKSLVSGCKIHDGVKASKVEWAQNPVETDENFKLVTTGFSSQAERQIAYWDMRMFSADATTEVEPLQLLSLDNGTGALFPFFDSGAQMLYVAGKGDGNVRFFEATKEEPYLHFISHYSSQVPQKGFTCLPKRCVDVMQHEIMRGLKLEATAVVPISWKVPRKSELFQEDIFPSCPAPTPAMTGEKWCGGAEAKMPILQSMKPGDASAMVSKQSSAGGMVSVKDLKKQLAEAHTKIEELEKENAKLKAELAAKS